MLCGGQELGGRLQFPPPPPWGGDTMKWQRLSGLVWAAAGSPGPAALARGFKSGAHLEGSGLHTAAYK